MDIGCLSRTTALHTMRHLVDVFEVHRIDPIGRRRCAVYFDGF